MVVICDRYVGHVLHVSVQGGRGPVPIWLENVICNDSSSIADLSQCSHDGWGVHNCSHDQDVYISCSDRDPYGTAKLISALSPCRDGSTAGMGPSPH